jgi:hypothetical protein
VSGGQGEGPKRGYDYVVRRLEGLHEELEKETQGRE